MKNNKNINKNLKRIRESKGLKQNYVAEKLGISANYYTQIENGARNIQVHHLPLLKDILNIKIDELFFDNEIAYCDLEDRKEVV